ncbi:MAG: hypothetical protein JOZ25_00155, partial [Actinobacteria bacterium]|nr:hypothetical protein [Actinomycetota bacterium]
MGFGKLTQTVVAATLLASAVAGAAASGAEPPIPETGGGTPLSSDVQHLHFKYGPIHVAPGQNLILIGPVTIEKPAYDGYVTRFKPNLVRADGTVPPVDIIHLHHGVFLNMSRRDATTNDLPGERFFATGEEKTIFRMPPGYGYFVRGSDVWALNYMVHNQTPIADDVWITYDVDYVPASSRLGKRMKAVHPVWMDVENGKSYPVFDVHHGAGGRKGRWTFPDDASKPYGNGPPKNVWTAPRDGTLIATAGHLHPGGLWDDMYLERGNGRGRNSVHIFRSKANYYDPHGPISWDLSMTGTRPSWRVPVRKGQRLRVTTTYDTKRASWYESMGIMVAYMADGLKGPDPFRHHPSAHGTVTHGPLPENSHFGGEDTGAADPRSLPNGQTIDNRVGIEAFEYTPGGQGLPGVFGQPP